MLRAERAGQQPLQGHPVQAVERRAERLAVPAGVPAGRHYAAVAAVAMDEPGGFGRHPGQVLTQAQVPEHPGGVGGQADRGAGLVEFGGLLEHLGGDAALPKQERQREPADAGPDDHDRRISVRHLASPRSYPDRDRFPRPDMPLTATYREGMVEFGILGPLEITAGGQPLPVQGARTRAVLAMLLVHANQVVPADRLTAELWAGQPADRAAASLQVRVSQLRKALRAAGEADRLVTRPPGYLIRVTPGELDAPRFEHLTRDGETALAAGDGALAARRLDEALGLWRGAALADVDDAPFARGGGARLEEQRLAALESRAEARLACGGHRELIGELETLTAAHPLRERLWAHRMLALYRAGRQAEALRAYRDLRAVLTGELGIEPSPALRELEGRILRQDAALAPPAPGEDRAGGPGARSEAEPPVTRYARSSDDGYTSPTRSLAKATGTS